MEISKDIARAALLIGAVTINIEKPFMWTSGYRMPIYNDCRRFLFYPHYRKMIAEGFEGVLSIGEIPCEIVAGTSTAGIAPATTLSDRLVLPLIYVRDKPKGHGRQSQIEGIGSLSDLQGRDVVLIEDIISTGASSARAVQAIRDAGGCCHCCLSIFDYGFRSSQELFLGLEPRCETFSLFDYDKLIEIALASNYITAEQSQVLSCWRDDPINWSKGRLLREQGK